MTMINRNIVHPFTLPRWIILMEEYPEFKIINQLVQQPDTSVSDALDQFSRLTSSLINTDNADPVGVHPWHTFCSLIEVAKRTDHEKQAKLVEFVVSLQKVKVVNPTTGEQLKSGGQLLWTEMPTLGYTAADDWNEIDVTDANTVPEVLHRHENFIALLARMSSAAHADYSDSTVAEMDFSFWSMRAFKEAFEGHNQQAPADAAVRTACMWLIYASDRLWSNILHRQVFDRRGDDAGTVMTQEMWESWEEALRGLLDSCSPGSIGLVDRALSRMKDARGTGLANRST